ncbi:MAG: ribonuclease R [Deltaproteobacteria bacterium]|nr:ribonuclease R [Deltaproteobacteria bacterium]
MRDNRLTEKVLKHLAEGTKGPASFRDLAKAFSTFGLTKSSLGHLLEDMVSQGLIVEIRGNRYGLPAKMNLVTGELSCHPDGYGFVRPEGAPDREKDIFISPAGLTGAMHGDTVVARIEGSKDNGRRHGRVIRVVQRARSTIVGRYEKPEGRKGFGAVIPSDERVLSAIVVLPGGKRAEHDDIVEAEIVKWPVGRGPMTGRIIDVLGDPNDPQVETDVILRKHRLSRVFPHDAVAEARLVPEFVSEDDVRGRVDLRGLLTVTIDGEKAKDFDDAVSIEKTGSGYALRVSIADVSHYVRENSGLDAEAFSRATSVYFPDRCIPMLPEEISNNIASLNPEVDRLTLTAELTFDNSGAVLKKRFYESVIRSRERLTYTTVKDILEGHDRVLSERYGKVLPDLRLMSGLAAALYENRVKDGSLDFDLPEPEIIIDIEGNIEDIARAERNIAHRIIEEFMLAANRAVAEEFHALKLPFIYRVHDDPDEDSIAGFLELISAFGLSLGKGRGPLKFQKVLNQVKGAPHERLVNTRLLRSMKQAVYSEKNTGHFGLGFKDYTHFTSPIRRYPDLIVHRLLKLLIHKRYSAQEKERFEKALPEIAAHTSAMERRAMEAEREVVDLKRAQFMKDKEGVEFDGVVSGVTSFGVFVELKEYFVEALVHVSNLYNDYFVFDEKSHTLTGEKTKRSFSIGDPLRVKITVVDIERRRIDALMAEDGKLGAPRTKADR